MDPGSGAISPAFGMPAGMSPSFGGPMPPLQQLQGKIYKCVQYFIH